LSLTQNQFAHMLEAHDFFEPETPIAIARAPGRLDFMGGNVDYSGGMVLQSLLQEAVWVAVQPRSDDVIRILNPGAADRGWRVYFEIRLTVSTDAASLRAICHQSQDLRWLAYVLGTFHYLQRYLVPGRVLGANLFIASDLPPNKGISSSAALEIAVLKAVSTAHDIPLTGIALATAGQWVENVIVGSACGIMDQAAIVLGQRDQLLPLVCQPCHPLPPVTLSSDLCIWGIDSLAPRATVSEAYETARAAAFIGYKLICQREDVNIALDEVSEIPRWTDPRWNGYLSNLTPSEFHSSYERWLPESASGRECLARIETHVDPFTRIHPNRDYPIRAAVRYATEENARVRMVQSLLESSSLGTSDTTLKQLGEILRDSHAAYADCGLRSEACDSLVARIRKAGIAGAKMTGGGAGGVVAALGRPEDEQALHRVAKDHAAERHAPPCLFSGTSDGVDIFNVRLHRSGMLRPLLASRRHRRLASSF
jgi:galactokinase